MSGTGRSRQAKFLAGALAKVTFLAAIGIGPQQARPVKTADVAEATRPPAVTRTMPARDVQAWLLGAAPGDTLRDGTASAQSGDLPSAPDYPAETGAEE